MCTGQILSISYIGRDVSKLHYCYLKKAHKNVGFFLLHIA